MAFSIRPVLTYFSPAARQARAEARFASLVAQSDSRSNGSSAVLHTPPPSEGLAKVTATPARAERIAAPLHGDAVERLKTAMATVDAREKSPLPAPPIEVARTDPRFLDLKNW